MERIFCLLIGYAFGLIQMAFIIGKLYRIDIRKEGSGNAGSTNALRVLGLKAGLFTFGGDLLKCFLAVLVVWLLFSGNEGTYFYVLLLYTGIGVTLGHNFPFYLRFKGGKGIAVLSAVVISTAFFTTYWFILIPLFVFVSSVLFSRYISLGSLQISALFFLLILMYGQLGGFQMGTNGLLEIYALALVLAILAWIRHGENIKRLIKGEESQVKFKKQ